MSYPTKSAIPQPCPTCGGKLERRTVDPKKPLGMVVCENGDLSITIQNYVKSARAKMMARVQAKRGQL
jgi:endogenous inhibitor of DNA gyrase (YacG/DUF329 family)